MAYVLVQHLAPHHKSLLVELLGSQSPISVVAAEDGLAVKANCVFVIPPDATLTIKDAVLRLETPAPVRQHRRPIDTFLTSLAADCGERAVGIVLAGVGSDGTIGIRSIKEHGGFTLAQAEFDHHAMSGMPRSAAASGMVDDVMPVEGMPARLIAYHKHLIEVAEQKDGNGGRQDIQEHLAAITSVLHARSEHDFSGYKEATLIRRLQRRMQVLNINSATDYVERLRTDHSEVEALFREFLIGVTQFFRDPEAFDALKVLAVTPMLDAKVDDESIRVWVPGCSTGEEVYSLAILLREALQARSRTNAVTIFGTDIDASAVAIARSGRYRNAASGLSPERFERWFAKVGDEYCPLPEIRDMCVFSTHSLVKDPPFSRLDLISCRNVMIYFDEELQDRLIRTFHYALLPGGSLFLGTAESVTRNARLFTALDKKHRILQRRDAGASLPALQPRGIPALAAPPSLPLRRRSADDRIEKAVGRLMQHYAPAYFVIDGNHEITRFSGAETGHYLEPSQGAANLNLFSVLRKSLRSAVRAAVSQALADGQRVINENLTIRIDGRARALTLIVEPIGGENDAKTGGSCVVAFRDASALAADNEGTLTPVERNEATVQVLERELHGTKAQLQAASDELEMRIEDMKSTTEEFQAVNEELQSSNEELETAKEEMQSVNEELQTINSELGTKNEQLTRLNSDMQNLLESTQIATVFLDEKLRIKHFTPAMTKLFPVRDSDRGRPITQFVTELNYTTVQADVEKVQRDGEIVEHDVTLKDGTKSFVMRIRPYRTTQNTIDGVVITFVEITERKHAEEAANSSNARFQALFDASPVGMYLVDSDLRMRQVNQIARPVFGDITDLIGGDFIKHVHVLWHQPYADEIVQRFRHTLATGEPFVASDRSEERRDRGVIEYYEWQISRIGLPEGGYGVVCYFRDIAERKQAEQRLTLISHELQHRSKNLIAVIQSVANRTLADGQPIGQARKALVDRLHTLGMANDLLSQNEWRGAPLKDIIEHALKPFAKRYSIEGPLVLLKAHVTQGFALVVHELSTNAHKYGAFSVPTGMVAIRWSIDGDGDAARLVLRWQELRGPRVAAPKRASFGTQLLKEAVSGGKVQFDYAAEGFIYIIDVAFGDVAEPAEATH